MFERNDHRGLVRIINSELKLKKKSAGRGLKRKRRQNPQAVPVRDDQPWQSVRTFAIQLRGRRPENTKYKITRDNFACFGSLLKLICWEIGNCLINTFGKAFRFNYNPHKDRLQIKYNPKSNVQATKATDLKRLLPPVTYFPNGKHNPTVISFHDQLWNFLRIYPRFRNIPSFLSQHREYFSGLGRNSWR